MPCSPALHQGTKTKKPRKNAQRGGVRVLSLSLDDVQMTTALCTVGAMIQQGISHLH
jgi:hypothetical protein